MQLLEKIDEFINFIEQKKMSPSTILAYRNDLYQLNNFLEKNYSTSIEKISSEHLISYVEFLKKEGVFSLKTISRKINSMKSFFKYLQQNQIITVDISKEVKHPKFKTNPPRILSKLEYRALRDTSRSNLRLNTIIQLLLQTGIRIGELARLKIKDFDQKNLTLYIEKYASNPERYVPLNPEAVLTLKTYLKTLKENSDSNAPLFITKNNKPLLVRNIRTSISKAFEKAGIEKATVNDIRNTFIVHQLKNGMPLDLLSKIVGHKRISSTKKFDEIIDKKAKRKSTKVIPL